MQDNVLDLTNCNICPRHCGVNRYNGLGFCRIGVEPLVASIFLHKGEEPVISGEKGICNVFFAHCNLQCIYCQNHQISKNHTANHKWLNNIENIVENITKILDTGVSMLGFVSPSHQVVQMLKIIEGVKEKGYHPTIVYNSNGYDNVETLRLLENVVDVYLPDFKYFCAGTSKRYSGVADYFDVAAKAIREMYRQKGSSLILNEDGTIAFGLIVRHLVLPGHSYESIKILKYIAENLSPRLHVSLMSQYYPPENLRLPRELERDINENEYVQVVNVMHDLGLRGWIQEPESQFHYRPDFNSQIPFLGD